MAAQAPATDATFLQAALSQTDPASRVAALERFLTNFPASSHRAAAQQLLLDTYLTHFPEKTQSLHRIGTAQLAETTAGLDRWMAQAHLADQLADAGDHGADLEDAELWAEDAVRGMSEPVYRRQMALIQARYKLPPLSVRQLHEQYATDRASCLAALANVRLRQAAPSRAAPLLAEARTLDRLSPEVNRLEAELLLAEGEQRPALDAFLRANAIAPLPPQARAEEVKLFRALEQGDEAALDRRIDAAYGAVYPLPFTLPRRQLPNGGHPVLLELFTGSDCVPCAGPDLALDSLLRSYSHADLNALEFDEHIPQPDPLASPDTVARAAFYGVESTPTAFLDGVPLQVLGSSRHDVQNIVVAFADQLEEQAALPSSLRLQLQAERAGGGQIQSSVTLAIEQAPQAAAQLTTGETSLRVMQRAVLYVALVQDHLRYSGKNGVRFHRMVVRALHQLPAATVLTSAHGVISVPFDPAEIDRQNAAYRADFEEHNDRFGAFHFNSPPISVDPIHLELVAWVQDPFTRRVLQSVSMPVPSP